MSESELFDAFLSGCMALCAIMTVVSLVRYRSLGARALVMGAAFLFFGFELFLLKIAAAQIWVVLNGIIVGALLITDFAIRSVNHSKEKTR